MEIKPTHNLFCAHQLGWGRKEYYMPCVILKDMGDGRVKIRVFGDRYWRRREDNVGHIRYVRKSRVTKINSPGGQNVR